MQSMASVAHLAAGLAGARALNRSRHLQWRPAFALAALSVLPDVDVLAFHFGIPYSAPFGHRGATHSLLFALLSGAATALLLCRGRLIARSLAIASLVALTHPLLDSLTDGGLGVALLWPFSPTRFFSPWRPIPVAPIGARLLTAHGLHLLATEALFSLPLLLWSAWPRPATAATHPGPP